MDIGIVIVGNVLGNNLSSCIGVLLEPLVGARNDKVGYAFVKHDRLADNPILIAVVAGNDVMVRVVLRQALSFVRIVVNVFSTDLV